MSMDEEEKDWIVILVCDNIPNQKFWDGADWTTDLDKAKIHPTYGSTIQTIWFDISQEAMDKAQIESEKKCPNIKIRITSSPIKLYRRLLSEHASKGSHE